MMPGSIRHRRGLTVLMYDNINSGILGYYSRYEYMYENFLEFPETQKIYLAAANLAAMQRLPDLHRR